MLDPCCHHNLHPHVSLPNSRSYLPRRSFPSPQTSLTFAEAAQQKWARPSRAPFGQPPAPSRNKSGTSSEQVRNRPFSHEQLSTRRGAGPTGQRAEPHPWQALLPAARAAGVRFSQEPLAEEIAAPPPCRPPSPSLRERGQGVRAASALDLLSPVAWRGRQARNRSRTGGEQASQPQRKRLPVGVRPPCPAPWLEEQATNRIATRGETDRASRWPFRLFLLSRTCALSQFPPEPFRTASPLPQRTRPETSREQVLNRPSRHEPPPLPLAAADGSVSRLHPRAGTAREGKRAVHRCSNRTQISRCVVY
jgi:hypothetical protein